MDIYILRDGKEVGPFSEEAVRTLIKQEDITEKDMARRRGLPSGRRWAKCWRHRPRPQPKRLRARLNHPRR